MALPGRRVMESIKFTGRSKKDAIKKAVDFFYANLDDDLEMFLARCRVQNDGITIKFYPDMEVDIKKYREFKRSRRRRKAKK